MNAPENPIRRGRKLWTEAERDAIRELYPTVRAADIAALIGRSISQVQNQANIMGVRKTPATVARLTAESMASMEHPGRLTQFKKGMTPWNKGKKGWQADGVQDTQFRTGSRPNNWVPVGSERITHDGYVQRKVTDTGYTPRDWVSLHVLIWTAAHGPVPPKHIVKFIDGNTRNFALDNLRCISQADNMRLNSVHNLPKPLAELAHLRGVLNRKINAAQKGEQHGE